jgi:hypothetical protein
MIILAVTKTVNYETELIPLPLTPLPLSQQGFLPLQRDPSVFMTYWMVGTETQKPENVISIHNKIIKSPN